MTVCGPPPMPGKVMAFGDGTGFGVEVGVTVAPAVTVSDLLAASTAPAPQAFAGRDGGHLIGGVGLHKRRVEGRAERAVGVDRAGGDGVRAAIAPRRAIQHFKG